MSKIDNGRDNTTRHYLSEIVPLSVPFNIQLEPSDICNFRCEYCVHSNTGGGRFHHSMEWDGVERIVRQLKELSDSYKIINLIGYGEPLIYRRIADMVALLKKAELSERIEITTNASLLTPEMSDKLIEAGLTRLIVSLQGLDARMYKKICGFSLDFEKFKENIIYFYKHRGKCKLHLKIADTALADGEEERFYEMFGDYCNDLYIEHIIPVFHDVDYEGKLKQTSIASGVNRYGYEYRDMQVCPQPFYQMFIKANGDVVPCCMYPSPVILGNIYRETLKEIWNGERHRQFMRLQLEKRREENPVCRGCINPAEASHPMDNMDEEAAMVLGRIKELQ